METETNTTEIIPADEEPTAVANLATSGGFIIDPEDIHIPRLNVVQKTSAMEGEVGDLVLDKKHVVIPQGESREICVLAAQKMWREDIPYEQEGMPIIAYNHQEMQHLKRGSDYEVIEFAEITLAIEEPEGEPEPEVYTYPIGDKNYCLGKLNVAKNAYQSTYKSLATFASFNREVPLTQRLWTFASYVMEKGKYKWFVPSLTVSKNYANPEVVELAQTIQGQ